jgi:hypothetical protein
LPLVRTVEFPDLSGNGAIAIDIETFDPDIREKDGGPRRGGYKGRLAFPRQKSLGRIED